MSTTIKPTEVGTAFLTTPVSESADKIFTLEQRDEEQRWIEESAATFVQREVLPKVDAIDHQEPGLMSQDSLEPRGQAPHPLTSYHLRRA